MLRIILEILKPLPIGLDVTFGPPDYAIYGYGAWLYASSTGAPDAYGAVEWINCSPFVTQPKLDNPKWFAYKLKFGVLHKPYRDLFVKSHASEIILNGIKVNPTEGIGFPWHSVPPPV